MGEGVGLASPPLYRQRHIVVMVQSLSNSTIGKILRLLIDFLCLNKMTAVKTKPATNEVCAVFWFSNS